MHYVSLRPTFSPSEAFLIENRTITFFLLERNIKVNWSSSESLKFLYYLRREFTNLQIIVAEVCLN